MADESYKWSRPEWLSQLPSKFRDRLEEIYESLDRHRLLLVPAGLRTLIELVSREAVGAVRPMPVALQRLHERGLIGEQDKARLVDVVNAANASVHEGHELSREAVLHMLMCVERLLQSCFVLLPHPELREVSARRPKLGRRPRERG